MNHPTNFPIQRFQSIKTPFYYYNLDLLKKQLQQSRKKQENMRISTFTTP